MDKLYFNEKECIGLSIGEVNCFTDEEIDIIKKNKVIFSSYYNFDSKVRTVYRYIDVLINSISTAYDLFGYEIRKILNCKSLKEIFLENQGNIENSFHLISKIHEKTSESINKVLYLLMIDILEKNINYFDEIEIKLFNVNCIIFQTLFNKEVSEKTILVPFVYSQTRQKNKIVLRDTFMKIELKSNKIYITEKKLDCLFNSSK